MESKDYDLYCFTCQKRTGREYFHISSGFERVDYSSSTIPSVTIRGAEDIGIFCSLACREIGRAKILSKEELPVRRSDIVPIEQCAKCSGIVDMSKFHMTYTQGRERLLSASLTQPRDDLYLAVFCPKCIPSPWE